MDGDYCPKKGFAHFGCGMAVGLSGMAAGTAIGIVGDAGVRATAQQPKLFVGMILILIFAEALGLYGLIVALVMSNPACPAGGR
eukprot:COSAG04_NODE_2029_length_4968_cov_14.878004_6_plen_84_part_00